MAPRGSIASKLLEACQCAEDPECVMSEPSSCPGLLYIEYTCRPPPCGAVAKDKYSMVVFLVSVTRQALYTYHNLE